MFDLTALWAFYQKRKQLAGQLLAGILIFAAGWQLGRVMSPYYAAHPIVFNDRSESKAGGSSEELVSLQQEGQQLAASAKPAVAGAQAQARLPADSSSEASAKLGASAKAGFVASVNSNLYHHADCAAAKRIKDVNQVWFASQQEAEAAGYSPSKCTQEKLATP